MSTHPDEAYFNWLYGQIGSLKARNPARTHWAFAKQLYQKEFVWFVPNDDNRAEDGQDLRGEFLTTCDIRPPPDWMHIGCSMLELLIALSRHLSFIGDGDSQNWFWEMVENLGLSMSQTSDAHYNESTQRQVDEALDRVIFRTYDGAGNGGLFPLSHPSDDQRGVELWYQLNAYLLADL